MAATTCISIPALLRADVRSRNDGSSPSETSDLCASCSHRNAAQFAAQSTAVVCSDSNLPSAIGDLYRLFVVLQHSDKPVVTGSFSAAGLQA